MRDKLILRDGIFFKLPGIGFMHGMANLVTGALSLRASIPCA